MVGRPYWSVMLVVFNELLNAAPLCAVFANVYVQIHTANLAIGHMHQTAWQHSWHQFFFYKSRHTKYTLL